MYQNEISKEEVATLELIQYEGPICVIDSMEAFEKEIEQIEREPVLGFDTETRPSFKKGKVYPTSLIQISSLEKALIKNCICREIKFLLSIDILYNVL